MASEPARTVRVLMRGNACISCRRRKQRWYAVFGFHLDSHHRGANLSFNTLVSDGVRPVCQQCTRFNRVAECVFEQRPRNQAEQLSDRVKELENLIVKVQGNLVLPAPAPEIIAPKPLPLNHVVLPEPVVVEEPTPETRTPLPQPEVVLEHSPVNGPEPNDEPPAEVMIHLYVSSR